MATNKKNEEQPKRKVGRPPKAESEKKSSQSKSSNPNIEIIDETNKKAKRQIGAIVLFAISIFILCLTLIPGGNVWAALQTFIFGMFGVGAFLWPLLLIYISVMASLDKPFGKLKNKVIEVAVLIMLICGAFQIGSTADLGIKYGEMIKNAWEAGKTGWNGGFFGVLTGGTLLKLFGTKLAAGITIGILIFVVFMITTGTTLIKLFTTIAKPAKKVSHYAEERMETAVRPKPKFNPNVDLGPPAEESRKLDLSFDEEVTETTKKKKEIKTEKAESKIAEESVNVPVKDEEKPKLDDIISKMKGADTKSEPKETKKSTSESTRYDDIFSYSYRLPPLDCLRPKQPTDTAGYENEIKSNAEKLTSTLHSFGVEASVVDILRGPSVTRYELKPAAGVKISRITGLTDDIALNLAAGSLRIEAPIPNKAAVGIEVPNKIRSMVTMREMLETPAYDAARKKSKLSVALGKDIAGREICTDLAKMPHLLVAGTTGSGKSVCLNSMIVSILYNATPEEVRLILIDPKQVEFNMYNGIPHLLIPVVSDPRKASGALGWAVSEMLQRYKMFSDNNVRDISGYNNLCKKKEDMTPLPFIVIVIDELSDLMMAAPNEVEDSICRLAQMARAAGMHLVIATQRPSVDVITGLIKANIPSRLALSVSSQIDSRTILDTAGAEKLLGNGDMLFSPVGMSKPLRVQGCFLSDSEVEEVVKFIKEQGDAEYDEKVQEDVNRLAESTGVKKKPSSAGSDDEDGDDSGDEMLPKAIELVVEMQMASTTLLQRKLKLGYARAARIVDQLEERGIVGPYEGSKPRKVLISKQQWIEMNAMGADRFAHDDDDDTFDMSDDVQEESDDFDTIEE